MLLPWQQMLALDTLQELLVGRGGTRELPAIWKMRGKGCDPGTARKSCFQKPTGCWTRFAEITSIKTLDSIYYMASPMMQNGKITGDG
jgi:hypothetical protein